MDAIQHNSRLCIIVVFIPITLCDVLLIGFFVTAQNVQKDKLKMVRRCMKNEKNENNKHDRASAHNNRLLVRAGGSKTHTAGVWFFSRRVVVFDPNLQ
jgi:anaerobic C4-dicarboxylate transporter